MELKDYYAIMEEIKSRRTISRRLRALHIADWPAYHPDVSKEPDPGPFRGLKHGKCFGDGNGAGMTSYGNTVTIRICRQFRQHEADRIAKF